MIDPDKKISIVDNYLHSTKFECEHLEGFAIEYIPQYYCVNISYKDNSVRLASSYNDLVCHGVALHDTSNNSLIKYVRFGVIHFNYAIFTNLPMTPIFMGASGELTVIPPNRNIIQRVGYIMSTTSAFIDIQDAINI